MNELQALAIASTPDVQLPSNPRMQDSKIPHALKLDEAIEKVKGVFLGSESMLTEFTVHQLHARLKRSPCSREGVSRDYIFRACQTLTKDKFLVQLAGNRGGVRWKLALDYSKGPSIVFPNF